MSWMSKSADLWVSHKEQENNFSCLEHHSNNILKQMKMSFFFSYCLQVLQGVFQLQEVPQHRQGEGPRWEVLGPPRFDVEDNGYNADQQQNRGNKHVGVA